MAKRQAGKRKAAPPRSVEDKKEKEEEPSQTDDKVDYISMLSDDLLGVVFGHVDHKDLDEMSVVNRRMYTPCNLARDKAIKLKAHTLRIAQLSVKKFAFGVLIPSGPRWKGYVKMFCLEIEYGAKCGLFEHKQKYFPNLPEAYYPVPKNQLNISSAIIDRAHSHVRRFCFGAVELTKICIDENWISFIENVITTRTAAEFETIDCSFHKKASKTRFTDALTAAKLTAYSLDFSGEQCITQEFLTNISMSPNLLKFDAPNACQRDIHVIPDDQFAGSLSNFRTLEMPCLVVDPDWLTVPLLKRLEMQTIGKWVFTISNHLDPHSIASALQSIHTIRRNVSNSTFNIDLEGTSSSVRVETSEELKCPFHNQNDYPIRFKAYFT